VVSSERNMIFFHPIGDNASSSRARKEKGVDFGHWGGREDGLSIRGGGGKGRHLIRGKEAEKGGGGFGRGGGGGDSSSEREILLYTEEDLIKSKRLIQKEASAITKRGGNCSGRKGRGAFSALPRKMGKRRRSIILMGGEKRLATSFCQRRRGN